MIKDFLIMFAIILFLLFIVCFKANYISEGNKDFFNLDTSKAMRGFWCLIVVLVHIPQQYQIEYKI